MSPDLIERLIPRVDDFQENMEDEIKRFKNLLRRKILVCHYYSSLSTAFSNSIERN